MTPLDRLTRETERGSSDRALLDTLLDEVPVGTLSTVVDGEPWSVPILFARDGDRLLFHGSTGAGLLRHAGVAVVGLVGQVQVFVPKQSPASALFGFQRRVFGLEFLDERGDFRGVVGALENGHGA